ncbi:MAG: hypothetical protein QM689_12820 [Oscillospiraceae bacterium]
MENVLVKTEEPLYSIERDGENGLVSINLYADDLRTANVGDYWSINPQDLDEQTEPYSWLVTVTVIYTDIDGILLKETQENRGGKEVRIVWITVHNMHISSDLD